MRRHGLWLFEVSPIEHSGNMFMRSLNWGRVTFGQGPAQKGGQNVNDISELETFKLKYVNCNSQFQFRWIIDN